ncbi:MAG: hypothetical protein KUG77_03020, partial [Nannocystaceae bacterium]|nr:hypothetical protein [Nannocystaceae bacterium]
GLIIARAPPAGGDSIAPGDDAYSTPAACMTEAGGALETQKLVYGSLKKSGGSYVVEISVLDVTTGQVEAQGTLPFDEEALAADNVDTTALEVVNSLYPRADAPLIAATPLDEPPTVTDDQFEDEPTDDRYIWGPYKPRPAWKKVGLGISASVVVLGTAASIAGWWYYKKKHEGKVLAAIERDPNEAGGAESLSYCRDLLKNEDPNAVEDEPRSFACQSFIGGRNVNVAGAAVAVVGGISTIVFTTLMFVHKNKHPESTSAKPPRFRLSGGPMRGGAVIGGQGRF